MKVYEFGKKKRPGAFAAARNLLPLERQFWASHSAAGKGFSSTLRQL